MTTTTTYWALKNKKTGDLLGTRGVPKLYATLAAARGARSNKTCYSGALVLGTDCDIAELELKEV